MRDRSRREPRCPAGTRLGMARRGARPVLLAVVMALGAAVPAGATTASLSGTTLEITGGAESSNLTFGLLQQNVSDSSGITPGPGCTAVEPTKVVCPDYGAGLPDYTQIVFHLGDGNDVVGAGMVSVPMTIYTEGGDDTVFGGEGKDTIFGGEGRDDMTGNGDSDLVDGGPGDDSLRGGTGNDRVVGGPGRDSVNGDGPDILSDGNDQIDIADGELDQAQCGFGADIVNADALDVVEGLSCEVVNRAAPPRAQVRITAPSQVRVGALLSAGLRVSARFTEPGTFRAVLSIGGAQARRLRLGSRGVTLAAARGGIGVADRAIVLRVGSRYRRALRRAGRISASVRVTATTSTGRVSSRSRTVVIVR